MSVIIPKGAGQGHFDTTTAFRRLQEHANTVEEKLAAIEARMGRLSAPLTLDQIQQALSASGSHPLNITNLTGDPAITNPNIPGGGGGSGGGGGGGGGGSWTDADYGTPCNPRSPHADTVATAKSQLEAEGESLLGDCGAFKIVERVVTLLQATGEAIGTLRKPGGTNCDGHSTSLVVYATGAAFDILIGAGDVGGNGPQWAFNSMEPLDDYEGPACTP